MTIGWDSRMARLQRRCVLLCLLVGGALGGCGGDEEGTTKLVFDGSGGLLPDGGSIGGGDGAAGGGDGAGAGSGDTSAVGDGGGAGDGRGGGGSDGGGDATGPGGAVIDAEAVPQPLLIAKLDGQESLVQSFWLDPNPQANNSQRKIKIELTNQGDVPLRIDALTFQSETPQIVLDWYDTPLTPADYPYELQPFTTLTLQAIWTTEPKLDGQAIATLTVVSNDPKQPKLVLTMATPCTDAKAVLSTPLLEVVNAAPFDGKVACLTLGNIGCKPLTVQAVSLQPADPRFSLVKAPEAGATIGVYGGGDNPTASPVALPICVRFEPKDESQAAASVQLVVSAQGGSAQSVQAKVNATWTPPSHHSLACGGKQAFVFPGGQPGAKATCKLQNHGPAPLKIAALELQPVAGTVPLEQIEAAFAVAIVQGGEQSAPWTVAAGAVAELQVTWKAKATPPAAQVRLRLERQSDVDELTLPVLAGLCNQPALLVAPAPPAFSTPIGSNVTGDVVLANQSCAPLVIVDGCVTAYQVSQEQACDTGIGSDAFSLVGGAATQTIPPWGLATLQVRYAPKVAGSKPDYGQLHQYWCRGTWNGGSCTGPIEKTSIQLEGTSKPGLVAASATLKAQGPAVLGKSVWLKASIQPGNQPIADQGSFRWWVAARPTGSSAWYYAPVSDGAARQFVPDLAGSYTIAIQALSGTPGQLTTQVQSKPALVTLTVP